MTVSKVMSVRGLGCTASLHPVPVSLEGLGFLGHRQSRYPHTTEILVYVATCGNNALCLRSKNVLFLNCPILMRYRVKL